MRAYYLRCGHEKTRAKCGSDTPRRVMTGISLIVLMLRQLSLQADGFRVAGFVSLSRCRLQSLVELSQKLSPANRALL
jgi:hypothetical protein